MVQAPDGKKSAIIKKLLNGSKSEATESFMVRDRRAREIEDTNCVNMLDTHRY